MAARVSWQGLVERVFFKGRTSRASEACASITANLFLLVVVFYIVLNTIVYDWTGTLYTRGFHLNTAVDNLIPFMPVWAVFYLYLFYPLSVLTMAWFTFVEYKRGIALAFSLVLINLAADLVYLVFPVTTDIYRAALLAHPLVGNPFAAAMYAHYQGDPSFNCFPSLHAAVSVICFYAWYRFACVKPNLVTRAIAIGMLVVTIGVILSTLFVKQHYIADEIAGILLAWGVGKWMFDFFWKPRPVA